MTTPAWRKLGLLAGLLSDDGTPPGGAPSGTAGGELAGTFPDPTVASSHAGSTHAATQAAAEATAAGALSTHAGASDPHPGYLTAAEGGAAYDAIGAAAAAQAAAIAASQPLDADLTAIAALTTTAFGRGLLDDADAAAGRTSLGLGTAAVAATGDFDAAGVASAAVSTHAGLSDPHPGYLTPTEGDAAYRPIGYVPTHAATTGQTANDHHAQLHHAAHEPAGGDAMAVDAAAATGSLRTLGTGATNAAAGNDSRLSDARTPTAHASTHLPTGSDPANKFSQSAIGTLDQAIANTETVLTSRTFAANELVAGQMFRFEAWFTKAGTQSAAAIIRIRIGTTTLTGNIAATLTTPNENTAVPGKIEGLLRIVADGAGGTARGELSFAMHLAAVTLTMAISPSTGTVAVNTTTANQLVELTFISGHASNTYTFRNAVMYRVA